FHCALARVIGVASRHSRYLALFIFSMIASTLIWSQNVDLITNVRVTMWRVLSAFVLYLVILRPLAERGADPRPAARRRAGRRAARRPLPASAFITEPRPLRDLQWTPRS